MSLYLDEWFGFFPNDASTAAQDARRREACPFLGGACTKRFSDQVRSGGCSAHLDNSRMLAICPNRLYADNYKLLSTVAFDAFGPNHSVIHPDQRRRVAHDGSFVVAFGKGFGREIRLPQARGTGSYFVDWVLARLNAQGRLAEFVALEVQTIDTTGTYRPAVEAMRRGERQPASRAGLNWENVNKRILPQLIYKGHVLRHERLCTKGLYFASPVQVYEKVLNRLGGQLDAYHPQPGAITFLPCDFAPGQSQFELKFEDTFTTTVDQVATHFVAPSNLPPAGAYEDAIRAALA